MTFKKIKKRQTPDRNRKVQKLTEICVSFSLSQIFSFAPVAAQRFRWVVLDCHPSKLTKRSHAMIAEIEFHEAGNKQGVFMLNDGTKEQSLVVSSSGDGTPKNPAWQSVDGLVRYKDFAYGYDAVLKG